MPGGGAAYTERMSPLRRPLALVLSPLLLALVLVAGAAAADRPVFVEVAAEGAAEVDRLATHGDVDAVFPGRVRLYTRPEAVAELRALGFAVTVLPDPGLNPGARMDLAARAPQGQWDAYPTWSGYVAMMQGLADSYPHLCRLVDLGPTTNLARPHRLLALRISDHPDVDEDEPEVLLTSTMHGDETTGFVTLLRFADELLRLHDPASSDPEIQRLTRLVDEIEIWINPLANPDGTYYASDSSVSGAIRYYTNASGGNSGKDPNRNFPDPLEGPPATIWAETQRMMDFQAARRIDLAANYHGGTEVVNYPWDTWAPLHADDAWYRLISHAYADQAQADGPAGYMDGYDDGITNGFDWYEADGTRQDWTNWFAAGREVTIEVSDQKNPPAVQLPTFWQANRLALVGFVEQALAGVRGLVLDGCGRPVAATVTVLGHDFDHSEVRTDPAVGDYHRLLAPGVYALRFEGAGFAPVEVSGVVVDGGPATRLDVSVVLALGPIFCDGFEAGDADRWSGHRP